VTARVALLCADLDVGGIQSMVEALGRGLPTAGFEPRFVCFDRVGAAGERLAASGFPVDFVARRPGVDLSLATSLRRLFAAHGIGLVHAHNRTALFYAVAARAMKSSPALLYTEHDRSFPEALKVRLLHAVLARRLERVVAVCRHVRDAIVATERFPAGRTSVILNGVADPPDEPSRLAARSAVATEFGIDPARPLLLAIGHLTAVKDHATLLDAVARLPEEPAPYLIVAGDGPLRGELLARRAALGLEGRVAFPGYRNDVDRLLRAADVLVMSSISEGLSIALVEAAARSVPIVATAVGGNDEVVVDGVTGRLVPPRDPAALAAALAAIALDRATGERLGRGGRARFEERFRLATMVAAYAAVYREALAASASRRSG
jgi:glycosyltransferase involved in cell wall biosynthesis